MNSLHIAIYASIAIHFLRKTARLTPRTVPWSLPVKSREVPQSVHMSMAAARYINYGL